MGASGDAHVAGRQPKFVIIVNLINLSFQFQ